MAGLFGAPLHVVNVGLDGFAEAIERAGGRVTPVEWRPPAGSDAALGRKLASLLFHPEVEAANDIAFRRYLAARPVLEGVAPAAESIPGMEGWTLLHAGPPVAWTDMCGPMRGAVIGALVYEGVTPAAESIPGMDGRTLLHAGPPVAWTDMCGPMRGAVIGALVYEGWANDAESAAELAASGDVAFVPCHHRGAVGPMAGVISPSMPVWVVRDATHGGQAFCNLNEGLGRVLRFGANDAAVLERLRWMAGALASTLAAAIDRLGGVELEPLMAQALHMGDEVHNRNVAASSLFLRRLAPALVEAVASADAVSDSLRFMAGNDHFFLNLSMAACKAMLDAAHGVPGSSMVTAMARNGVEFGIRVSGLGDRWFTAPAPRIDGLFFPGYGPDDGNPDLGDSAITETAGVGGFAMATAPAIVQFVGGSPRDALANTREMTHITIGRNGGLTLPALDFEGTPAGIDVRKVVDTGIAPVINTGIAHRDAGVGQVGAGITRAPSACFVQAVSALADAIGR